MLKARTEYPAIKKLENKSKVDVDRLLKIFNNLDNLRDNINKKYGQNLINDQYEQSTLTYPSNGNYDDEKSYDTVIEQYQNTYLADVISIFNSPVTRIRFIRKKPGAYILPHIDYNTTYSLRFYIPLQTNEWAFTHVKEKNGKTYTENLKADGSIYFVNPGYLHSACNLGNTDDIRLIFSVNGQNDF